MATGAAAAALAGCVSVDGVAERERALTVAASHTDPVAPYEVLLPQAGETIMSFTNNHLQYAVTWYGLGAALIVVFIVFVRGERRNARD